MLRGKKMKAEQNADHVDEEEGSEKSIKGSKEMGLMASGEQDADWEFDAQDETFLQKISIGKLNY